MLFLSFFSAAAQEEGKGGEEEVTSLPEASELPESAAAASCAWLRCLSDGLHLSSHGNSVLGRAVLALLQARAPEVSPAGLPADLPHWSALPTGSEAATEEALSEAALQGFREAEAQAAAAWLARGGRSQGWLPGVQPPQSSAQSAAQSSSSSSSSASR